MMDFELLVFWLLGAVNLLVCGFVVGYFYQGKP